MAAERPRRRITQPCLEYNGGLLHKEEIMLRRAMYASLVESKKPSPSKPSQQHPTTSEERTIDNLSHDAINAESNLDAAVNNKHSSNHDEFDNNNKPDQSEQNEEGQCVEAHASPSLSNAKTAKNKKTTKEPSKLLNYVIKKKKEKKTKLKALFRTASPSNLQTHSDTGVTSFCTNERGAVSIKRHSPSLPCNGKSKKKKRQRGALAVFVAMNKSAGGKINNNHGLSKELLLKAKKKRRRKRKNLESQGCQADSTVHLDGTRQCDVETEESPVKKSRREEKKKPSRMVHAQRKFAKNHPLSPTSMRYQEEANLLTTACSRAKTEDFLTFLCLRHNPVLPKELEVFNHPCLPMSPLSEEDEDNSSPPSPTQSQSSMSNASNPSSAVQKSYSDSPAPSVDSPAMGEGPSWESGVVRMYADGPKGLAGNGKEEKKYDELLPSDEADSPRELTKSVTPPLAFRVSSRPTNLSAYRSKDKQLPRPIPKPFAVKPTLTGASVTRTSFSPFTGNVGNSIIPPPPPLLQSSDSSSCSSPPPPLLYIPAAAQRVTHLHGPPTLQRYPSTSPTRDQENEARAELPPKLSIIQDEGPPPLKRFPPVVIDLEGANNNESTEESVNKSLIVEDSSSEFRPRSLWARDKNESKAGASAAKTDRSSTSLCDLTKISNAEAGVNKTTSSWSSKEMPLLRRHSSASQYSDAPVEETSIRISRAINCSSSPPRLQRVAIPVDSGSRTPPGRVELSGARGETSRNHIELSSGRFPSHPPILVRHSTGYLEDGVGPASLQKKTLTSGIDHNRRLPSPLGDLPSSRPKSAQSIQERNYARPIPVAEPLASSRHSPLFMSYKEKFKSTYVFSNRQMFPQTENGLRPVQVSSLVMSNNSGVNMAPNRSETNLMSFQSSVNGFGRSNERQLSHSMYSQYAARPSSSSYVHRPHDRLSSGVSTGAVSTNRQFNNSPMGFKRIPSPRSDLFSGISPEPVNTTCIQHVDVPSRGSLPSGNQPTTLRSTVGQNENMTHNLPPRWSHLESSYSIPSASRNSPPKPYTFSVNLSQSRRQSGTYSVSHSNLKTQTIDGYSLSPTGSRDGQQVSVIQRASVGKGERLNSVQRELCVGEQENYRTYHLPTAFQGRDSRPESSSNALSSDVASGREQSHVMQSDLNDHNAADLMRDTSSPLARPSTPAKPPPSNSPSLKGTKNKVSDSTITDSINVRSTSSSPKIPKKTVGSKRKEMICPSLEKTTDSPVFHPSEEEFKDPAAYIKRIRCDAEKFGVCVIVPPDSWKPEFQVSESVRFNSECQLIHRLQDRWGPVEDELACIKKHLDQQSISIVPMPQIGGYELDLPQFSRVVKQFGGLQKVIDSKKWTKIAETLKIPRAAQDRIGKLQDIYCKYLLSYDLLPKDEKDELLREVQSEKGNNSTSVEQDAAAPWSVKGRSLALVPFQRIARNVQGHFFKNPPSVNEVEREFWRFVHNRETYVSVHRGTVDTNHEDSCFPTDKGNPYSKLGWNLNVLPHLPGSVLKHVGFVQDVTVPWVQFDMIFSVKPWQTHPLALYTVEYLHSGVDKIWYSVAAGEKNKFESLYGQEDSGTTETVRIVKMVSPSSLTDSGLKVTRIVQKQGQFVIVFPEAYYSSVSCGYSISEAVAFAPPDWVVLGSKRYKDLQGTSWWSEFAFEKLLLGLAKELTDENQEVLQCLLTELKSLRDEEKSFMAQLVELGLVETLNDSEMKSSGSPAGKKGGKKSVTNCAQADSSCVLYCEDCDRPCYLSAVTSEDDPQVLCLKHAVEHIREKRSPEGFRILSRHDTCRLDELVNKVEDKLKKSSTFSDLTNC